MEKGLLLLFAGIPVEPVDVGEEMFANAKRPNAQVDEICVRQTEHCVTSDVVRFKQVCDVLRRLRGVALAGSVA